jgi:hypothetical protein
MFMKRTINDYDPITGEYLKPPIMSGADEPEPASQSQRARANEPELVSKYQWARANVPEPLSQSHWAWATEPVKATEPELMLSQSHRARASGHECLAWAIQLEPLSQNHGCEN